MSLPLDIFTPAQAAILIGFAAVLGACLGSFVNCLAWRRVPGARGVGGRSLGPRGAHHLGPLDLVPIVSWLALRGRCRHCGQRVSARYVVVEVTLAAVFVALLAVYGAGVPWIAYAALTCILMAAALVDLDTFTIPNGFVVAAVAVWALLMVASAAGLASWPLSGAAPFGDAGWFGVGSLFVPLVGAGWQAVALDGLAGAVAVGGGILVASIAFDAATKRASLGGGDVKLLFAVGLFLGLAGSLLNLLVACVVGLALAFVPGLSRSQAPSIDGMPDEQSESFRTRAIPFGPAIAAATVITLLVGPTVLAWYVGLF